MDYRRTSLEFRRLASNVLTTRSEDGWSYVNIPINNAEHIKAMYDYLVDITQKEEDTRGTARGFYCSSNSWNDIVRNYVDKAFKPLIDFIIDSLSMEMMSLEPNRTGTNIYQSIGTNYGTANIAQGDVHSNNSVGPSKYWEYNSNSNNDE